MNSREKDLAEVLVTLFCSISTLQEQCSEYSYLLGDRLPGLSNSERLSLKATSQTYHDLGEKTKSHAKLLKEVCELPPYAATEDRRAAAPAAASAACRGEPA